MDFYSHASREARQRFFNFFGGTFRFLLTRLSRGATLSCCYGSSAFKISTHTPLARRDIVFAVFAGFDDDFYSHASREARLAWMEGRVVYISISTHTPLARRDLPEPMVSILGVISTHTPLARRDGVVFDDDFIGKVFLLTRLSRGATISSQQSDFDRRKFLLTRLSRGATRTAGIRFRTSTFLLTRLSRGATLAVLRDEFGFGISTHTPLARRDPFPVEIWYSVGISTHTPLARRDKTLRRAVQSQNNFYSHASREARRADKR